MKIEILGTGCAKCKVLEEVVELLNIANNNTNEEDKI